MSRSAAAVLIVGLAAASVGEAASERKPPALHLVWVDPTQVASTCETTARAEATRLLGRLGAVVHWRSGRPHEDLQRGEIYVVLLGPEGYQASPGRLVLGATRTRFQVARVAWVRVSNVRAALGVPESRSPLLLAASERLAVGVAIGRVVAHEVVHALVPSLPHGRGLMSSELSRRHLTRSPVPVDLETALAFQAALRGDAVLPAPGPGIVASGPEAIR